MKTRSNGLKRGLLQGLIGIFLLCPPGGAWAGIAKVANFTGDVVILSGLKVSQVRQPGPSVHTGDTIQTEQGTVQIALDDGKGDHRSPDGKRGR